MLHDSVFKAIILLSELETPKAPEEPKGFDILLQYLDAGGWMMYVILLVSIVGVVIFLERSFNMYFLQRLSATSFIDNLTGRIEAHQFRQAVDICAVSSKHPLPKVIKAGLLRANKREKEIERAMEKEMLVALPHLQKRVGLLSLLANTSTLLGLLGTIFGLIAAFSSVAAASAAERQEALASGISQAMYTTAFGIVVAVPLLFFHHILSRRADQIIGEIETGATSLLVTLTGVVKETKTSDSAAPNQKTQPAQ